MLRKPASLRKLLLERVPALKADPSKLSMFVDKGDITARATGSLSFAYAYTLNIVVQDYAGDVDALMVPLLAWIQLTEPGLLERAPHKAISFESEILDAETADVSIDLELSERVRVLWSEGNQRYEITHLDDTPRPDVFPGAECAIFRQGAADGETLVLSAHAE